MNKNFNIYYTQTHEWLRLIDDKFALIGITDFAQNELSDIIFVEVPEIGITYQKNDVFGSIEAVKTVTDLVMPVTATIVTSNPQLLDKPELINLSPLDEGWIIKIQLIDLDQLSHLLSETQYKTMCEKLSS